MCRKRIMELHDANMNSCMQPFFSGKNSKHDDIVLVEGDRIISEDMELAETFNSFFQNSVASLNLGENKMLLSNVPANLDAIDNIVTKFASHPSILSIEKNVHVNETFSFTKIESSEVADVIKGLKKKRPEPFWISHVRN